MVQDLFTSSGQQIALLTSAITIGSTKVLVKVKTSKRIAEFGNVHLILIVNEEIKSFMIIRNGNGEFWLQKD